MIENTLLVPDAADIRRLVSEC